MSHLLVQGLFHIYYVFVFFSLSLKLWMHGRKTGNLIARNWGISFMFAGFEYISLASAILFFPYNAQAVVWLSGVVATIFTILTLAFGLIVVSYIVPKLPVRPLLALLGLICVGMIALNLTSYEPKGITPMGTLDLTLPKGQIVVISLLLMLVFVPIAIGFIYRTFKKHMYVRGICMGVGLLTSVFFLPLTYQVKVYSAYVFFSFIASFGFLLLVSGVWLHPSLNKSADEPAEGSMTPSSPAGPGPAPQAPATPV